MRKQLACFVLLACGVAVPAAGQDAPLACAVDADQKASAITKSPGGFDIAALDTGLGECGADHVATEHRRLGIIERTAVGATNRRARGGDDHSFGKAHRQFLT